MTGSRRPASFIYEMPGDAHTLVTDDPDGCKLFGWMQGPNEFYDGDGNLIDDARCLVVHGPL